MKVYQALIVDDSKMIIKIIKKALLEYGVLDMRFSEDTVYTASDGMEAFAFMAKKPDIKLIITDINMPNLNGDEFIEILQDTNKINDIDIVFITSGKIVLKPEIKNSVLGIIYKPFNAASFSKKLEQLYKNYQEKLKKQKVIQKQQQVQKKELLKIIKTYLERNGIEYKEQIVENEIKKNIGNDLIQVDEYIEVAYAILSFYIFERQIKHTVDVKQIRCIIKEKTKQKRYNKNPFGLIRIFNEVVNQAADEDITKSAHIDTLIEPIDEKISLIYASSKKYPKQATRRFLNHFNYIVEELRKIDCEFIDDVLQKSLNELDEIVEFQKYLKEFIQKNKILTTVTSLRDKPHLLGVLSERLKNIVIKTEQILQHYCGAIDSYIWKRAKESKEIVSYLQQKMPSKMPNSLEFLYFKGKYTLDEYRQDYKLEHHQSVVVSDNPDIAEIFQSLSAPPFDNWSFHIFAKQKLLELWLKNNTPHSIIIDYKFKTQNAQNGIDFINQMASTYPVIQNLIKKNRLFLIANYSDIAKIQNSKTKFIIINPKLSIPEITKTLLYH